MFTTLYTKGVSFVISPTTPQNKKSGPVYPDDPTEGMECPNECFYPIPDEDRDTVGFHL